MKKVKSNPLNGVRAAGLYLAGGRVEVATTF
jgi:hypothetical protein